MHYPDREGFDFPSPFERKVRFRSNTDLADDKDSFHLEKDLPNKTLCIILA